MRIRPGEMPLQHVSFGVVQQWHRRDFEGLGARCDQVSESTGVERVGDRVVGEAENWLRELGFSRAVIESRDVAVEFYKKLGFVVTDTTIILGDTFDCIRMEKEL